MRNVLLGLTILGLAAGVCAADAKVEIKKKADASELEVYVDGGHFTTYHYSNDNRKPFLWPVYAEGNVTVTRDWPMDPDAKESTDHEHHKSMWTSYGECNDADCWGEGENSGYQQSGEVTFGSGDEYGWIKASNTWLNKDRNPVIDEAREYRFYPGAASLRVFDLTVTFTASHGKVVFKDTKEGGIMSVRMRPEIQANKNGVITNALGKQGERQCWGKPSPWCDYAGPIGNLGVRGVAILDHPSNLRHPTRWHVRDYGLMSANCFGLSHFTKKEDEQLNGDYTFEEGDTLTFRYRVIVHSGSAEEAKVAELYEAYKTVDLEQ